LKSSQLYFDHSICGVDVDVFGLFMIVDVLMHWCADDCVDMLMRWFVQVLRVDDIVEVLAFS